jgi:acylglycerol lipase
MSGVQANHEHHEGILNAHDSLSLYHQAWLPDGEPKGVVMLVHGLGEHSGRYAHVAARLDDAGYAVHAIDHRGHGKSQGPRAYVESYDDFLHDMVTLRDHVTAEHPGLPLIVLGHSMGGLIALTHVLDHQDGVTGLVLSGPALVVGDDFSPLVVKALGLMAKVAPKLRPQGLSADAISRDPEVVGADRAHPLVYTGKISAALANALVQTMQRTPPRYPDLTLPVLLLHGTNDQLADVRGSRQLEAEAENADVTAHYYEGLYHEVFNEPEQEQVLGDLLAWIDATVTAS